VDVLKLTLLGDAPKAKPTEPEAYALYLQAVHVGTRATNVALEQSNVLLKQVLALDPNYARAWRLLARNYAAQAERRSLPHEEGLALASEAINQALAIDPNLAEAHSWFGIFVAEHDGDLAEAAQQIRRGLSLEPKNPIVLSHSAEFLRMLGRLDETIAIEEYVTAHDPLNPFVRWNLSWNYLLAGRPDEAIATARTLSWPALCAVTAGLGPVAHGPERSRAPGHTAGTGRRLTPAQPGDGLPCAGPGG